MIQLTNKQWARFYLLCEQHISTSSVIQNGVDIDSVAALQRDIGIPNETLEDSVFHYSLRKTQRSVDSDRVAQSSHRFHEAMQVDPGVLLRDELQHAGADLESGQAQTESFDFERDIFPGVLPNDLEDWWNLDIEDLSAAFAAYNEEPE